MRQFDIVENLNPITRSRYPLAVVLQHDSISTFHVLTVAPMMQANPALTGTRLHPAFQVHGREMVVIVEELSSVHKRTLGRVVGSAEANRYAIVGALDLLFTGI